MAQGNSTHVPRRALVVGGSIAGLFAATLLGRLGWEVDVFERSAIELSGRGAGIVTHPELIEILELNGAGSRDLGISIRERITVDRAGHVIARLELPQLVTSWDRLHQMLRPLVPPGRHHLGHGLVGIDQDAHSVTAHFANGRSVTGELLIGADGFRSTVRAGFAPDLQPIYAGYVVWRGLADERNLPPATHAAIFERFSFFLPPGNVILSYPIAGPDNDLRRQHRRFNWVWYRSAAPDRLKEMLTDATGTHHEVSIAPPLIRDQVIEEMRTCATVFLARPFLDVLERIERPFFAPIYDLASSRMVFGRVALIGDAAHVKALWGRELPAFDTIDAANELIGALVMGLWNRLTHHQERAAPFRLIRTKVPATRAGMSKSALLRREELDGFVEGLFGDKESLDLPERAHTALGTLAEIRAMLEASQELADDLTKPAEPADIAVTLGHFRELALIAEHEMNEAVLSCTRARRQMLQALPATKPVLH